MATTTCPVCQKEMSHRGIKRHLVTKHGYRYRVYKDQPDFPVEIPSWWRPRELDGKFRRLTQAK